jgi:hypothetical protein
VKTCYLCGPDVTLKSNFGTAHVVADVLGYFYPVDEDDFKTRFAGVTTYGDTPLVVGGGCTNNAAADVSITVAGPGYIEVTAQTWLKLSGHSLGVEDAFTVHIGDTPSDCTFSVYDEGYIAMGWRIGAGEPTWGTGVSTQSVAVSRTFTVDAPGTYSYYLNGQRQSGAGLGGFWYGAMQAKYFPDR